MRHLLLIDDDPALILDQIEHIFCPARRDDHGPETGEEGLKKFAENRPDVVLIDVRLPDLFGNRSLSADSPDRRARTPAVFITATTAAETAIEAVKEGAYDYLFKPLDLEQLSRIVGQAPRAEPLRRACRLSSSIRRPTRRRTMRPVTRSSAAVPPCAMCTRPSAASPTQNVIVLITGESGTGKELVARAIYQHSAGPRPVPGHQLRRHPREPARKRAVRPRKGRLHRRRPPPHRQVRAVRRRHLFLDEIGDMPLATQAKDPAAAAGAAVRARRRQRDDPAPTCASSPRPIAISNRGPMKGDSATTCTTG